VMINALEEGYSHWATKVKLLPYSRYHFSGWVKTEVITSSGSDGAGFSFDNLEIGEIKRISGNTGWTQVSFDFETRGDDSGQLNCVLGFDGKAKGKAWFDDLELTLIETRQMKPTIVIHADSLRTPMSEYIYGQFIEHLGKCIYGGIWAEVIDDRKFYYMPGEKASPWKVSGDSSCLSRSEHPYVGLNSPLVTTKPGVSCTLYQAGIGLLKDMDYTGSIVLSGNLSGGTVSVTLKWGNSASEKETMYINSLNGSFTKIPLKFRSKALTNNAAISIEINNGAICSIGTLSLMPANNIDGFRSDVIALLRELNSPVYRWPGGNFVSGYNWQDGIGERDLRPPRKNPAWRGVEHNDVGIDEFMNFCRLLNTQPYIAVNTGLGNNTMAAQEVEYCNGKYDTPMGRWRSANGHPEPYNVKYWAVGNEMYGSWQIGNMPVQQYVNKHNDVSEAMKKVDPSIQIIGVGAVGPWDELMLTECSKNMDFISEHIYRQQGPGDGLMTHVKQLSDDIRSIGEAHRKYRKQIGELKGKNIRIAMDEWNYWYGPHIFGELGTRYFLRDALGIAAGLNEYSRNSDIYFMANYAQTVNVIGCIKTTPTAAAFETTGLVLKMYREHFGQIPVAVSGTPMPLDVAVMLSEDKTKITIAIVNPTHQVQKLNLALKGISINEDGKVYFIQSADDMVFNDPGMADKIQIQSKAVKLTGDKLIIPPVSSSIYVFDVAN